MKHVVPILFIFIVIIFAGIISDAGKAKERVKGNTPCIIITSDLHLSLPEGRWPDKTKIFRDFLDSEVTEQKPEIIFIVGDVIDNVIINNKRVMAGFYKYPKYFERETALYKSIIKQYPQIQFMQSLGPGHDFIGKNTLEEAEKYIGKAKGSFKWQGIDFVWFTVKKSVFRDNDDNVLSPDDYTWLDEKLDHAEKAVLLFHIPLRTKATYEAGKWNNKRNLTIPPSDKLYGIIDRHANKILAVFNGHIHEQISSSYKGIPVYLCPLTKAMSYAVVTVNRNPVAINVAIKQFRPKQ